MRKANNFRKIDRGLKIKLKQSQLRGSEGVCSIFGRAEAGDRGGEQGGGQIIKKITYSTFLELKLEKLKFFYTVFALKKLRKKFKSLWSSWIQKFNRVKNFSNCRLEVKLKKKKIKN